MSTRLVLIVTLLVSAPLHAQPVGPRGNLLLPPDEIVRRMRDEPFQIADQEAAGGGVMGAKQWLMIFADGQRIEAKWKKAPRGGEGWNNRPRLEIAAYAVQQWFLDPADQVVPPVTARCVPLAIYRRIDADATANLPDAACVFGALSAWLSNVSEPGKVLDRERFSRDHRFAYHLAHLNLLAYLIHHKDGRANNFLVSTDPTNPQLYSVDNGISFGAVIFNWFTWHLDRLRVGGLPRRAVERLRRVTQQDLDRLGVVGQMQRDADGVLRSVPTTANLDPTIGTRLAGPILQFGLTQKEIAIVGKRRARLLQKVDSGAIAVF